jgi:hypothetical protein
LFAAPDIAVTSLRGDEFGTDRETIRTGAMQRLNEIRSGSTPLVNRDTGWTLTVGNKDWTKIAKNPKQSTEGLQAIAGISDIVDRAVLAESHTDTERGNLDVQGIHRLYAPLEIDGKLYRAKLTVRDYKGADSGERTNLHALQAVEIEDAHPVTYQPLRSGENGQAFHPSERTLSVTEAPGDAIAPIYKPLEETGRTGTPTGRTLSVSDLLKGSKREDGADWAPDGQTFNQDIEKAELTAENKATIDKHIAKFLETASDFEKRYIRPADLGFGKSKRSATLNDLSIMDGWQRSE